MGYVPPHQETAERCRGAALSSFVRDATAPVKVGAVRTGLSSRGGAAVAVGTLRTARSAATQSRYVVLALISLSGEWQSAPPVSRALHLWSPDLERQRYDLRRALVGHSQLDGQLFAAGLLLRDGDGAAARAAPGELFRAELGRARVALRHDRGRGRPPVRRQLEPRRENDELLSGPRPHRWSRLEDHRVDLRAVCLERVVERSLVRSIVEHPVRHTDRPGEEVEHGRVADLTAVDGDEDLARTAR